MGLKDMVNGLTGKSASDKKAQDDKIAALMAQIEALKKENAELSSKNQDLEAKNTTLKANHVQGAKNAYEGGLKKGIQEGRHQMTEEAWRKKYEFKDLPKQEQMSKLLDHIAMDEILPQEQDKVLKTLSELMQSESADIMHGERSGDKPLLQSFCQHCYVRGSAKKRPDMDFLRKSFKIILNAKGKNGPKADITSHLPTDNPLIGYFATRELFPLFDTAIDSHAFDITKVDGQHLLSMLGRFQSTSEYDLAVDKLLIKGYQPIMDSTLGMGSWAKSLINRRDELKKEGALKPKMDMSKKIKEIHTMSVKQMRDKLVKEAKNQ